MQYRVRNNTTEVLHTEGVVQGSPSHLVLAAGESVVVDELTQLTRDHARSRHVIVTNEPEPVRNAAEDQRRSNKDRQETRKPVNAVTDSTEQAAPRKV